MSELTFYDMALIVGWVLAIGGAVATWLRGNQKQAKEEAVELADTRGKRIEDLEAHVARLDTRIVSLESRYEALYELKSEQIAARVAELVVLSAAASQS